MANEARHLVIRGKVQKVGYRAWLAREAQARGLSGWARNRIDGTVEAVVAGAPAKIATLLAACRGGPPAARVLEVEATSAEMPARADFVVLPTE